MARDASGAAAASAAGEVVVIVDVVDMSTTLESALEAGAAAVFGASPAKVNCPAILCPAAVGYEAGLRAARLGTGVVVVAEPRGGTQDERRRQAMAAITGVEAGGGEVVALLPNLGKETPELYDLSGQVVLAVTASGGVAFDAAFNQGGTVVTGTIARTLRRRREEPARCAAMRALQLALPSACGITIVAASGNSMEDILGAEYIYRVVRSELSRS